MEELPSAPAKGLGPQALVEEHLKLAERYLEEGKELVEKDPVQASEKLYKAAEEVVKALAAHFNLELLQRVEERGRWTVAELERAVEEIGERVGSWFGEAWDRAWALHVWGFHEAKLDARAVGLRAPYVERMVREARRLAAAE